MNGYIKKQRLEQPKSTQQNVDDVFTIAEKAEKLLHEILNTKQPHLSPSSTILSPSNLQNDDVHVLTPASSNSSIDSYNTTTTSIINHNNNNNLTITQQPQALDINALLNNIKPIFASTQSTSSANQYYYQPQQQQQQPIYHNNQYQIPQYQPQPQQQQYRVPLPHEVDPNFFALNPPPTFQQIRQPLVLPVVPQQQQQQQVLMPFNYQNHQYRPPYPYHHHQQQQQQLYNNNNNNSYQQRMYQQPQYHQRYPLKRKFDSTNYRLNYSNDTNSITSPTTPSTPTSTTTTSSITATATNDTQLEEDDLNILRERELKDLKCKSVVEKMNVFLKYYQQFKSAYEQRLQSIECSDSLKIQFHSLIKYLIEYEHTLHELNQMIREHEHDYICKNNHRKTKKFFNKTKAFIRYECNKRLQNNIFEYRRQINSQDRFAGMYDILDMNNYLIGLLPDIGVSIRRYINKCEKSKQEEEFENELNEGDGDDLGLNVDSDDSEGGDDAGGETTIDITSTATAAAANDDSLPYTQSNKDQPRSYESFSKGVDSLNRYLLKRVENELSLDELVKERIIKWINKRQSKYILIFSEVDKLLNQHKDGECYTKFHSFLLFNLGKLVTVCDSYHQKLKELLYSTTIRRKKKRKKVKIVPESMSDVFSEINELKRSLEHTKLIIKKCNEIKTTFQIT